MDRATGSITKLIERLAAGDKSAAGPLWKRVRPRLMKQASRVVKYHDVRSNTADDVAMVAFDRVVSWIINHRQQADRHRVWAMLDVSTHEASIKMGRYDHAQKRDAKMTVGLDEVDSAVDSSPSAFLELDETLDQLNALDADARLICKMLMNGFKVTDICQEIGVTPRTVQRKMVVIRQALLRRKKPR